MLYLVSDKQDILHDLQPPASTHQNLSRCRSLNLDVCTVQLCTSWQDIRPSLELCSNCCRSLLCPSSLQQQRGQGGPSCHCPSRPRSCQPIHGLPPPHPSSSEAWATQRDLVTQLTLQHGGSGSAPPRVERNVASLGGDASLPTTQLAVG